ncbi:hypothetical protein DKG34_38865 [Streptomyces sp. NWU49]|uniref:hypothetical protein n=1 Tax=Streptomyces sp. NWU49 TaxID=2201153 RepID=UPI000D67E6D1|nr:hypothetical protein DKG34_38865 [Streptomyces sp. NWU49]
MSRSTSSEPIERGWDEPWYRVRMADFQASLFSAISPRFRPYRHQMTAAHYRAERTVRFVVWDQVTGAAGLPATA